MKLVYFLRAVVLFLLVLASITAVAPAAHAATPSIKTVSMQGIKKAVFSPDNKYAFVLRDIDIMGNVDSDIYRVDVTTGAATRIATFADPIKDIAASSDGNLYYSSYANFGEYFGKISTTTPDTSIWTMARPSGVPASPIQKFFVSKDEKTVYGLDLNYSIVTLDVASKTGTFVARPADSGYYPNSVAMSPNEQFLLWSTTNKLYQYSVGAGISSVATTSTVKAISFTSLADAFLGAADGLFAYAPYSPGTPNRWSPDPSNVIVSNSGKSYISSYSDVVKVLDVNTGNFLSEAQFSIGSGKSIADMSMSPDGSLLGAIDTNNATLSIVTLFTPRTISFDATTADPVPYGSTKQLHATVSAGPNEGTITYSVGSSTACTVDATGLVKMTSGTGTCLISASVTAGVTYGAASTTTQVTITPSKVPLTVSAAVTSFTYGGTLTPRFSITSGALVNSDVLSSVTYKYEGSGNTAYTSQTTAPTYAGTYSVTPSLGLGSTGLTSKYNITYTSSIFSIDKASRNLNFETPTSYDKSYGQVFTVTATPTAGSGDGVVSYSAGNSSACTVSSGGAISMTATSGTCVVSASISEGTNYLAAATTTQVVVNSSIMPITVQALGASISFGGSFVENVQLRSGTLASGDTITGVTYTYEGINGTTYGPTTMKPTNAGVYSQTPSNVVLSGNASNYDISYSSNLGTVEIRKVSRTLEFGATSYNLQYGQLQSVLASPSNGNGTVTYSAGNSTACTVHDVTGVITVTQSTGTCEITANISEGTNHLAAATTTPVTVTVAPRNITLTAGSPSVVVGNSFTASQSLATGTLTGSDAISAVTYTYAGTGSTIYSASTSAPTAIGTYSVTPSAAVFSAGSSSNYNITYVAGTLNITNKLSRTLSFATTTYALGYGQTQSVVASPSLGTSDGTVTYSVGSSTACTVDATGLVTVTARTGTCEVSATISEGSTYLTASTTVPVTVTVSTQAITVTAHDLALAYGGTVAPRHTVSSGTLATADQISAVTYTFAGTGSTTYAASTTAPTAAGTYSVTPSAAVFSSGSSSNYTITYAPGILTIAQPLTSSVTITMSATPGSSVTGSTVSFVASGLSSSATYDVVLRSTPQTIASGSAVGGALNGTASIPGGLEAGWHSVTFTSTGALGAPVTEVMYFKISSTGALLSTSITMPADFATAQLGHTGIRVAPYMGVSAVLLLVGALLVLLGTRRRSIS